MLCPRASPSPRRGPFLPGVCSITGTDRSGAQDRYRPPSPWELVNQLLGAAGLPFQIFTLGKT